ncbi:hypothetical protein [Fibrobacter sp.]|uniref:hypothetical protein n=1 Tax=Fibrobacter sp. TaxID=35828 RepID=UPI00386D8765
MKYTRDEALNEIRRRAKVIRQKRDRKIAHLLATTACISLISLLAVIGKFAGSEISGMPGAYGSFILSASTGGFVLAGILGFVLGVSVTLLIKYLKKNKNNQE